ncbi:alpha/beta fold hydrolase [Herbiconiux sp. 11R-BC]|uniref:alpha/beta fold hydrolase n=1 Tax=Herbiconiux sp. 11R-BC TaxID=3111637 RepID=UPI003C0AA6E3
MTDTSLSCVRLASASSAPVLVLGPSLGTSTAVWAAVAERLAADFTVVSWDLPGHGASAARTSPFHLADLADEVSALTDADEYFYAGVSLGGAVGLHLALRDKRMRGLAALCTGAIIGTPAGWHERAALVRASGTTTLVEASRQRWFAPGDLTPSEQHLLEQLPSIDDESYALSCEALARHDVRSELPRIAVPVLAAWGEHDLVTPAASAEEIAQGVPAGRTERIPAAGHLPPVEQPDAVASLLRAFFGALQPPASA